MKRMNGKPEGRRSMRRLILYAMFLCIILFLIVGLAGLYFLSNSYYAEFARNQNELLESYYHYIDKCMEDATRTSLRIIADELIQQASGKSRRPAAQSSPRRKPTCMTLWSLRFRRSPATALSAA